MSGPSLVLIAVAEPCPVFEGRYQDLHDYAVERGHKCEACESWRSINHPTPEEIAEDQREMALICRAEGRMG